MAFDRDLVIAAAQALSAARHCGDTSSWVVYDEDAEAVLEVLAQLGWLREPAAEDQADRPPRLHLVPPPRGEAGTWP
jgi:hypothetical protein